MEKEKAGEVKDENIARMSAEQKNIRMKMMVEKYADAVQCLREERKKILKNITKEVKKIRETEIDEIAAEIEATKEKMMQECLKL
jgi:replication fork clamp-binding protein CrfC